jgi:hypothetical protein
MTGGAANDGETEVPLSVKVADFSLLRGAQTGSETHRASCSKSIEGAFPGSKTAGSVKLTTHFHVLLNLRMSEVTCPLPICLHDAHWDRFVTCLILKIQRIETAETTRNCATTLVRRFEIFELLSVQF